MTKAKHDTVYDGEAISDARPNKKARTADTGGESNDVDTGKETDVTQHHEETDETTATMSQSDGAQKGGSAGVKRTPGALQPTLTVRSVLPNPTKCLIDNSEIEGYDEILVGQLRKLSGYTNAKANIYALGKLLPTATWGQYNPVNDRSKILCNPATGEPLTLWVVGRIARMWFTKFGAPENQASLTVMPLSKSLGQQSAILLAKMSSPTLNINQQSAQVIRAIKWQNGKKNDGETTAMLFDAVYDVRAEGSLKTYSERPLWNLGDLKTGDLILLEMKMTRYSKKLEDKWHSRAQYEMIAISLLDISDMPEEDNQGTSQIDGLAI
ncbi:hypothetical protein EV424DRAFT_1543904 [Suillus variegatus]|nr:hypothetical protein EV424DRAFT_1543904 [Suillus variegatus]